MRWVDKYNEEGEIKRHNRKPVAYKVHKDKVKFILDEIQKNKTITMQDLLEKLKENTPTLTLSRFHLNRIVNDNNITLKITRFRHEPNKRFGKDININKKIKTTNVQVLDSNVVSNDQYVLQREIEINDLARNVEQVNNMFTDLAILVQDQSQGIDNIESCITSTALTVEKSNLQLLKAKQYKAAKERCMCRCCCFLSLSVFVVVFVLVISNQSQNQ